MAYLLVTLKLHKGTPRAENQPSYCEVMSQRIGTGYSCHLFRCINVTIYPLASP